MASAEVLLPSPRAAVLRDSDIGMLRSPMLKGGGQRRSAEVENNSPPSKKLKKSRRRRKRHQEYNSRRSFCRRRKPVAPFNTTQFLMAEHDLLRDTDIVTVRPKRLRESSISLESDDLNDEYYSSTEDEEFLTREFWAAYEDVHAERLDTMTKTQLVQEYLALEEKVDLLEMQLRMVRSRYRQSQPPENPKYDEDDDDDEDEVGPGEVRVSEETAQKIAIFQSEITSLENENRRLREENEMLRRSSSPRSSDTGSSSSSSSDSSSSSSSDSSSDSEAEEDVEASVIAPSESAESPISSTVIELTMPSDARVSDFSTNMFTKVGSSDNLASEVVSICPLIIQGTPTYNSACEVPCTAVGVAYLPDSSAPYVATDSGVPSPDSDEVTSTTVV